MTGNRQPEAEKLYESAGYTQAGRPAARCRPGLSHRVREDAVSEHLHLGVALDGFILVPHLTPHGLDEFVDNVVPLLQERGLFRTEYHGSTLRSQLGLERPRGAPIAQAAADSLGRFPVLRRTRKRKRYRDRPTPIRRPILSARAVVRISNQPPTTLAMSSRRR